MNRDATAAPALMLLGRGIFNLAFGVAFIGLAGSDAMHGARWAGSFAAVDGLLGLAWAILVGSRARWLFGLALVDAGARLLIGALLIANPGIQASAIGEALFFSLMSVALMILGIFGAVCVLWMRPRDKTLAESAGVVRPALVSCALTAMLGLGLGLGFLDADKRAAWSAYCVAFGVLLCWSGRLAARNNERRSR